MPPEPEQDNQTSVSFSTPTHARPWERLPTETPKAYKCFCAYRDMPPPRIKTEVYRAVYNRPANRPEPPWFRKWSQDNRWEERVLALEQYLDRSERERVEGFVRADAKIWNDRRRQAREDYWALSQTLLTAADRIAKMPDVRVEKEGPDGSMTVLYPLNPAHKNAAANLARAGAELRDRALGENGQPPPGSGTVNINSTLISITDADLRTQRAKISAEFSALARRLKQGTDPVRSQRRTNGHAAAVGGDSTRGPATPESE